MATLPTLVKIRNNTATKRFQAICWWPRCCSIRLHIQSTLNQFPAISRAAYLLQMWRNHQKQPGRSTAIAGVSGKEFILKFSLCSDSMRSFYLGMHEKCVWLINLHRHVTCFPQPTETGDSVIFGGSHRLSDSGSINLQCQVRVSPMELYQDRGQQVEWPKLDFFKASTGVVL